MFLLPKVMMGGRGVPLAPDLPEEDVHGAPALFDASLPLAAAPIKSLG